jgi:hypothetical protein
MDNNTITPHYVVYVLASILALTLTRDTISLHHPHLVSFIEEGGGNIYIVTIETERYRKKGEEKKAQE